MILNASVEELSSWWAWRNSVHVNCNSLGATATGRLKTNKNFPPTGIAILNINCFSDRGECALIFRRKLFFPASPPRYCRNSPLIYVFNNFSLNTYQFSFSLPHFFFLSLSLSFSAAFWWWLSMLAKRRRLSMKNGFPDAFFTLSNFYFAIHARAQV